MSGSDAVFSTASRAASREGDAFASEVKRVDLVEEEEDGEEEGLYADDGHRLWTRPMVPISQLSDI